MNNLKRNQQKMKNHQHNIANIANRELQMQPRNYKTLNRSEVN